MKQMILLHVENNAYL